MQDSRFPVVAVLRLAAVMALYLLRTVLAPSGTLRGLRQMVLDAAPVPRMNWVRRACSEPLPHPVHDYGIPEYESGRSYDLEQARGIAH